jgi:4a-hydroxytetrahydrobiopterin dehydratase
MKSGKLPLTDKHSVPCEGGTPPLTPEEYTIFLVETPLWDVVDERKLLRDFRFKNFKEALAFVNRVGALAESEGHHPDIFLHNWNRVQVTLSTHAIKGLSENDYIVAAKIDTIFTS